MNALRRRTIAIETDTWHCLVCSRDRFNCNCSQLRSMKEQEKQNKSTRNCCYSVRQRPVKFKKTKAQPFSMSCPVSAWSGKVKGMSSFNLKNLVHINDFPISIENKFVIVKLLFHIQLKLSLNLDFGVCRQSITLYISLLVICTKFRTSASSPLPLYDTLINSKKKTRNKKSLSWNKIKLYLIAKNQENENHCTFVQCNLF